MGNAVHLCLLFLLLLHFEELCSAIDTITTAQPLKDPGSIVSSNNTFRLGFFTPANSTNRYLGIWYNQVSTMTVIWVANRDNPIRDSTSVLQVSRDGKLSLLNANQDLIWSPNVTATGSNYTARLLDSGNLVLLHSNSNIIWQSFDHPGDSLLPGMNLTVPRNSIQNVIFQSWKSPSDPSYGKFTLGVSVRGIPQVFTWDDGKPYWRSGPWDGIVFEGIPNSASTPNDGFGFTDDKGSDTVSIVFPYGNAASLLHYVLNYDGKVIEQYWDYNKKNWVIEFTVPETECDVYGKCGEFGICNPLVTPICQCLKGFVPKNLEEWKRGNWSNGCVRRKEIQCGSAKGKQDVFLTIKSVKAPDNIEMLSTNSQQQCGSRCANNCSCLAYAFRVGIGCMTWTMNLIDVQQFSDGGVDLNIRLAYSELGKDSKKIAVLATTLIAGAIIIFAILCFLRRRIAQKRGRRAKNKDKLLDQLNFENMEELSFFEFRKLEIATNYFQQSNKLGEGGFGPVYKGLCEDGQEIAVKRLSSGSTQGIEQFMNEVVVISKLQHRNLVKLLGCCIEGDEKMLIYEYVPNKSLDAFLFDSQNRELLTWDIRLNIIEGICRGLLYLHRDSRLKIIHRDLKASNILLDEELSPKISDFGMARIFEAKQDQANTMRIVGTYGYISPEYALEGHFSEKSDVFSFGVLLLEIISGRRNTNSYGDEHCLTLLGYAWKLWIEDDIISLIDPIISEPGSTREILRCMQVGLLCVQELARERPNISTVICMLDSETDHIPHPQQPGLTRWQVPVYESQQSSSINEVSVTVITGR